MATSTSTTSPSLTASTSTPSCTTAIPDHNGYVPTEACNAQWPYNPSFAAAVAFSLLFGLLTLTHLTLAITFRKTFCWVIIMAATWETVSFAVRAVGSRDQQKQAYAMSSQILFLLAPLWINAFVYMTAGRLIYTFHPDKKVWRFKAMSLGKWFVWLDIVSFVVQAAGGMLLSPENDAKLVDIGKNVYMGGVGLQEFFILVFLALIVKFHLDALKLEQNGLLPATTSGKRSQMWKWLVYALYAVLALITMRIVFRLAEFSGGMDPENNRLPFVEAYALGLDAFPMLLAVLILAAVHPGLVLRGEGSEFPGRKVRRAEKKGAKRVKKEQKQMRKDGKSAFELNEGEVDVEMTGHDRR